MHFKVVCTLSLIFFLFGVAACCSFLDCCVHELLAHFRGHSSPAACTTSIQHDCIASILQVVKYAELKSLHKCTLKVTQFSAG